jgi:asparagine synthase (glutamine-hydrolysing)
VLTEAKELYPNNLQRQAMYLDQHTYLNSLNDRNDRATMAASIECRVPFLDSRLMAGLGTLENEWFFRGKKNKFILKQAYANILPQATLNFRKVGFSVPWLNFIFKSKSLKQHWEEMDSCEIFKIGLFKFIDIKKLRKEYINGVHAHDQLLRQLFFISLWWKQYVEHFRNTPLILR